MSNLRVNCAQLFSAPERPGAKIAAPKHSVLRSHSANCSCALLHHQRRLANVLKMNETKVVLFGGE